MISCQCCKYVLLHLLDGLCEENEFRCPSHLQCYPLDWVCDGYKDCSDGFDEQDCTCENI